ncbi:MAG TPA: ribonuclease III [Cyanobacteria bacterium UBA11149]|nr:ribonuclease III [Cyanobacteria bacterium UBA11367]HBE58594.1 ribonuclease III [Cyanobacteria bacterium UBA11366]HBK65793.1 ribonuclease III [Cyanobacteria bacterium UBA11166]HBR74017.1 ribonuclease III [Cyanobacteria bacterium UBA11159]HBS67841.1 ribonuclease III [Cyanobacteria bacterium UBA11153]HBW90633.1 ribonuclease III [Cyanobacteria bacterium UBA11149]HCA93692.1 ribonuclease III [Cyanobacteria bacterium UBA9226]
MAIDYRRKKELQKLLQKLGLPDNAPVNLSLLDVALTHPSFSPDTNYEQLEFVGDAVVRIAASELLFATYPNAKVGEFAAIRSVLVSDRILAEIAQSYGLGRYLLVSHSAAADPTGLTSRLADAFEAVLGALYLSTHNLKLIRPWLDPHFQQLATEIRQDPARQNYKDALQEWTQSHHKILPEYRITENSFVHDDSQRFTAEVWIKDTCLGSGKGRSKKAAEQGAAKQAFTEVMKKVKT